jgi:hypothetical protein
MLRSLTRFEVVNLIGLRTALDQHNASCAHPVRAFLLNPIDHGLMRWDELWGVPVLADEGVPVKRFRLECDGRVVDAEQELMGTENDPA